MESVGNTQCSIGNACDFVTSRNQIFPITLQWSQTFQNIIDTHHCFKFVGVNRGTARSCHLMR